MDSSIVFLHKGRRTSGRVLKRAGQRLRVEHADGSCWISTNDVCPSRDDSSEATAEAERWAKSNYSAPAPPTQPATPSTPPPVLLSPPMSSRLQSATLKVATTPFARSPFLEQVASKSALMTPILASVAADGGAAEPPRRPKLWLLHGMCAWRQWLADSDQWLGYLERAQVHNSIQALGKFKNRTSASLRTNLASRTHRDTLASARRRMRRAAQRSTVMQMRRGLRAFARRVASSQALARLMRRAVRHNLRMQISCGFEGLWWHRDARLEAQSKPPVGLHWAVRRWRAAALVWRSVRKWRQFRRVEAFRRWRAMRCRRALLGLASSYARRFLPPVMAPLTPEDPHGEGAEGVGGGARGLAVNESPSLPSLPSLPPLPSLPQAAAVLS